MDYAPTFTRRLKVYYTSLGAPHQAVWRISNIADLDTFIEDVGGAFKATLHNTDTISRYEVAAQGSNVFLPVVAPSIGLGAGGRSGTAPTTLGQTLATQRTVSGRCVDGSRWKFVWFNALDADYDDFVINVDELDAADISYLNQLETSGATGQLLGNSGQSLQQVYRRYTIAINDHYVALYRRTRAG